MEPQYEALNRLGKIHQRLLSIGKELPVIRQKITDLQKIDFAKARIWYDLLVKDREAILDAVESSISLLQEIGEEDFAQAAIRLTEILRRLPMMVRDYRKVAKIIMTFGEKLPRKDHVTAKALGHLMNNVKLGYYPTDLEHLDYILRGITFPDGITTNLLDPCCGEGIALRHLAMGNNCMTYGVELDESRAEQAQNNLHRVAIGDYFRARICQRAFHLMLLNPPYLYTASNRGRVRAELQFLNSSVHHLAIGGLLIYIIPYYRLTPEIAKVLAAHFEDLEIYRFVGKEFQIHRQIAVLGVRKECIPTPETADRLCSSVRMVDDLKELTELPQGRFMLPKISLDVPKFQGQIFNEMELYQQLKHSDSMEFLYRKNELDFQERRPPLPLKIGQIGLIGGSGMINGLVRCDTPHVIKGRVVKDIKIEKSAATSPKSDQENDIEIRKTFSNRLIFNILTPNGFRSLT